MPQLVAKDSKLGQRRIVDLEAGPITRGHLMQGAEGVSLALLIVHHCVPVRKSASLGVLTRNAHVDAVCKQRGAR